MKFGSITTAIALATVAAALSLSLVEKQTPLPTKVAAAWFAGWHETQFAPKDVPWSKYTHVTYSFA